MILGDSYRSKRLLLTQLEHALVEWKMVV